MPAILDFSCMFTEERTFSDHAIERALPDQNQYILGQMAGKKNIKRGVDVILNHDKQHLNAVATYHNNPEFVAGNISAILKKELRLVSTIRKIIVNAASLEKTEIAINAYKVLGMDNPFLISYLPHAGDELQLTMHILENKNAQIKAIREFWLGNRFIKCTDNIDFYEDSFKNYNGAKSLEYITGYLVTANKESFTVEGRNSLSMSNISMMVLGGFIGAAGIAAIAIAFTVLNAITLGIPGLLLAGAGVAAVLTGSGLFACNMNKQPLTHYHSSMKTVKTSG